MAKKKDDKYQALQMPDNPQTQFLLLGEKNTAEARDNQNRQI